VTPRPSASSGFPKFINSTTPKTSTSSETSGGNFVGGGGAPAQPTSTGLAPVSPGSKLIIPGLTAVGGIILGLMLMA
jgi:hypothetical protein